MLDRLALGEKVNGARKRCAGTVLYRLYCHGKKLGTHRASCKSANVGAVHGPSEAPVTSCAREQHFSCTQRGRMRSVVTLWAFPVPDDAMWMLCGCIS